MYYGVHGCMGTGWVGGGVYPVPSQLLGEGPRTAKRAPEAPQVLEWVVLGAGRPGSNQCSAAGRAPGTTLRARSGTLQVPSLSQDPSECRLWAYRARFKDILLKVSQNGRVSPENLEKGLP